MGKQPKFHKKAQYSVLFLMGGGKKKNLAKGSLQKYLYKAKLLKIKKRLSEWVKAREWVARVEEARCNAACGLPRKRLISM